MLVIRHKFNKNSLKIRDIKGKSNTKNPLIKQPKKINLTSKKRKRIKLLKLLP